MPKQIMEAYGVEHPAPHRGKVSDALLFSALLAAPLAWAAQLLLNYALAANACFPREAPKGAPGPGWEWLEPGLLTINLTALAVAFAATLVAAAMWRRTSEEAHGGHDRLIDVGHGRTRFFAIWGVWSGVWFIIQILFGTIAAIGAPGCGS
ncbi:hypothetical protein [Methylocystis echinoides]|uniref:Uncharacterized protein n=1 Tax=Methylocystis echinoides TaxID=29468 RepID=A0A9W6GX65_9HYPH|nr:hypothetical protein [Methylocystis echinoides]GLI94504.1 hypothetical protein LMG27198_34960 [Methylocystis echinoides]